MSWTGRKWSRNGRVERFWDQNVPTACPVVNISPNILRVESETSFGLSLYTHTIGSVAVCGPFAIWGVKHWGPTQIHRQRLLGLKK